MLGSTTYLRNDDDTGRALMIDAWGLQLSTFNVDAGVNIGHVKRTYLFGGEASSTSSAATTKPIDLVSIQGSTLRSVPQDEGRAWRLGEAVAAVGASRGVAFHTSAKRFGISIGFRSGAIIALPAHGSRSLLLRASSTQPADYVISYREWSSPP